MTEKLRESKEAKFKFNRQEKRQYRVFKLIQFLNPFCIMTVWFVYASMDTYTFIKEHEFYQTQMNSTIEIKIDSYID